MLEYGRAHTLSVVDTAGVGMHNHPKTEGRSPSVKSGNVGNNLNQRQEMFCVLYVKYGNATKAGTEAGYSPAAVRQIASKMLTKHNIQTRIAEINASIATAAIMDVTERKERLSEIGREDIQGRFGPKREPNISAIAELNKIDHVYEVAPTVNVDNRKVEVTVVTPEAQALLERVMNGEGTEGE